MRRLGLVVCVVGGWLLLIFAAGYGCSEAPLACEPTGTYPGGIRVHGSQLCE